MATFTLIEYETVTAGGDPVKPGNRTAGLAFGAARQLGAQTVYYETIPDADAYELVSVAGTAATSADEKVFAGVGGGGCVSRGARPYVYLLGA